MNQYVVQWHFSDIINNTPITLVAGESAWLDEATAAIINNNSPGVLVLQKVGQIPHRHRMMTVDRVSGVRDIQTITDDDEMPGENTNATPAAIRLAESLGIDLADVSYAGDRITVRDVKSHVGEVSQGTSQPGKVFGATISGKVY